MIITIRLSDVPFLAAFCLLILPALILSPNYGTVPVDDNSVSPLPPVLWSLSQTVVPAMVVVLSSAGGGRLFFYDYAHAQRYALAIVLSWSAMGLLLWRVFYTSFNNGDDSNSNNDVSLLGLYCSIAFTFLAGLAIFCCIRHNTDVRDPWNRPPEQFDHYTIAKVADRAGWPLFEMSVIYITIARGVETKENNNDSNYYYAAGGLALVSAGLLSYGRPHNAIAFLLSLPTAALLAMHWASNEIRHTGDLTVLAMALSVLGQLLGLAVFRVVQTCCGPQQQRHNRHHHHHHHQYPLPGQETMTSSSSLPPSSAVVEESTRSYCDRSGYECLDGLDHHVMNYELPVAITDQVIAVEEKNVLVQGRADVVSITILGQMEEQRAGTDDDDDNNNDDTSNDEDSLLPRAAMIVPTTTTNYTSDDSNQVRNDPEERSFARSGLL